MVVAYKIWKIQEVHVLSFGELIIDFVKGSMQSNTSLNVILHLIPLEFC